MNPGTVTVEVTRADILEGAAGQPRSCAIALAARRALGITPLGDDDLLVHRTHVILERGGLRYKAFGGMVFEDFTDRFDAGHPVFPTAFTLTFTPASLW